MAFANNVDWDQTPQNRWPDLRSLLFDNKQQFLLKTGCIALHDLDSEDIEILSVYSLSETFWKALCGIKIITSGLSRYPLSTVKFHACSSAIFLNDIFK